MRRELKEAAPGVALTVLAAAVAMWWASGCIHIPAIGEDCAPPASYCLDFQTALACRDGHLSAFSCQGPKGCASAPGKPTGCDQSRGMSAGEACFPEYEGKGQCNAPKTSILQCTQGAWAAVACPTGTTCQADALGLFCK